MSVSIFHNPCCSKSRAALMALEERNIEAEVAQYLEKPPTESELAGIIHKLGIEPRRSKGINSVY